MENNTIETFEPVPGYHVEIVQDQNPQNPEEWGDENLFLTGYHREFWVKREGFEEETMKRVLAGARYEDGSRDDHAAGILHDYWIYPLDAYIHSGVALRLGESSGPVPPSCDRFVEPINGQPADPEVFDRSLFGFVFVAKKEFRTKAEACKRAQQIVGTWNEYLSGEVYGYEITDPDGRMQDSCWGFYGDDGIKQIKEDAAEIAKRAKKERDEKREKLAKIARTDCKIYDNGGKTIDRYTLIDTRYSAAYGLGSDPVSPSGFNQHIGDADKLHEPALGKRVKFDDVPEIVRQGIINRLSLA